MAPNIEILKADISLLPVDAIVNAANNTLLGGGGVDGSIHRAAGPKLLEECKKLGGCETGQVKVTKGHNLRAKWIIHTVGPIWKGGKCQEETMLAACYRNAMDTAAKMELKTIAFPAISCGAYGFPTAQACFIAWNEIQHGLMRHPSIEKATLACHEDEVYHIFKTIAE